MLQPLPQHRDAGFAIPPPVQEAPQAANPVHGLAQRRRRVGGRRGALEGAVHCLPCCRLPQGGPRGVGRGPAQQRRIQEAPGEHAVQRQRAWQPLSALPLPGFAAAAAFAHGMPDGQPPAARLPVHPRPGVLGALDRTARQQQPCERRPAGRRMRCQGLHRPQCQGGPLRGCRAVCPCTACSPGASCMRRC